MSAPHRPIIEVTGVSKLYRLGETGAGSLREAGERLVNRLRGRVKSATKREEFWALRDISFSVQRGEVMGLVGRNGAGKSTLLKVLSRITEPTAGRAVLRGRVASLLEVGTGFHPELSGRDNIFLNGAILGMRRAEIAERFDAIVEFAELGPFIDTPVKRYSSGMYTRLAFAIAAHLEAEILIVDEVLAVGDAAFQKKCLGRMGEVARTGSTVLFVSHNMAAVSSLCQTALLLEHGRITMHAPASAVVARYLAEGGGDADEWSRPASEPAPGPLQIDSARLWLEGAPPRQRLHLEMRLTSDAPHRPAFIAIDVMNSLGTVLMQALPQLEPFIGSETGEHELKIVIDLPPLVPDRYSLTLWVGPHFTETYHFAERVLAFEIETSPTPQRTFAHSPDHGFLVPPSTVEYLPVPRLERLPLCSTT